MDATLSEVTLPKAAATFGEAASKAKAFFCNSANRSVRAAGDISVARNRRDKESLGGYSSVQGRVAITSSDVTPLKLVVNDCRDERLSWWILALKAMQG